MANPENAIQQLEAGDEVQITGRLETGNRRTRYKNIEVRGELKRIDDSGDQTTYLVCLDKNMIYDEVVITDATDNADALVLVGDLTGVVHDLKRL